MKLTGRNVIFLIFIIQIIEALFNKKKVNTSMNAFEIFKQIYMNYDNVFILESLTGPRELSEFTVIGFEPEFTVKCDRSRFQVFRKEKMICDKQVVDPLVE